MNILEIENLKVLFPGVPAVEGVDITVGPGERVAIVGESGCGKSATALACMKLLESAFVAADRFLFNGNDLRSVSETGMQALRGREMAMVFQDPSTFLNPVMTIGQQLDEVFLHHRRMKPKDARRHTLAMLEKVGIAAPAMRASQYPHELSGGLKQRILIAMATALSPRLLIADEPTTALDVTIQAQILELLSRLCREEKMALLMITHDLGVVREIADRVYVMYCGRIVEQGTVEQVMGDPQHPYTRALLDTIPPLDRPIRRFTQRCDLCRTTPLPPPCRVGADHTARCHLLNQT